MKKKILMFVSNAVTHDPRVLNEAASLLKNGYGVTVVGWDRDGRHQSKEIMNGIKVVRVRNSGLMKILPYDIFRLPFWRRLAFRAAEKLHGDTPFDIVHCHDLDTLSMGRRFKRRFHLPLIYDAHEIWGYMVRRTLPRWWADHYLKKEERLIKYADRVITVSAPLEKYFKGISDRSITVIMNAKHLCGKKYVPSSAKHLTVAYLGKLNRARFVLELVSVMKGLPEARCIIGGKGAPDFERELKERCEEMPNVDFLGLLPIKNVIPTTRKADIVVCMFDPKDPITQIGLPNKVFEAMVCGRPIICSRGTYSGEFVERAGCGLTAEFNRDGLKKAIIKLQNAPSLKEKLGRNALKAALGEYSWEQQEKKLLKVYADLLR